MRTTYNKIIVMLLCGTTIFISCSKWLDVQPQTSIKADELFKSEAGFKEALIGVYISLSKPEVYGKELTFGFVDVLAQQYNIPSAQEYTTTMNYEYKSVNTESKKDKIWATQYNIITNINSILIYLDKNKDILNPMIHDAIKGEMLGLRGFLHLDLMRLFGYGGLKHRSEIMEKFTIPYSKICSKDLVLQNSYKNTIALIEDDLLKASDYLEKIPDDLSTTDMGGVNADGFLSKRGDRFNYWAAQATLARLYYWVGDDEKALQYAQDIITNGRWSWTSEQALSNNDAKQKDFTFSGEQLFSLRTVNYGNVVNEYFNPSGTTIESKLYVSDTKLSELFEIASSTGISDYRYLYLYTSAEKKGFCQKLTQRESANPNYSERIPMIRIPEIYMIAIDVLTNGVKANGQQAITYFNEYRSRRGIRFVYPIDSSPSLINQELSKEMRKEFMCEGQLFYFYKRYNLSSIIGTTKNMDDKTYLVPYPTDEIVYGKRVQ